MIPETENLGGIEISMCTWSGQTSASRIVIPFHSQSFRRTCPISSRFRPQSSFLRFFGAKTTWCLQFRLVCAKLRLSAFDIWLLSMLALVRKAIVRSPFRLCKAISSTELPDYRGVFTRSTLRVGSNKQTPIFFGQTVFLPLKRIRLSFQE